MRNIIFIMKSMVTNLSIRVCCCSGGTRSQQQSNNIGMFTSCCMVKRLQKGFNISNHEEVDNGCWGGVGGYNTDNSYRSKLYSHSWNPRQLPLDEGPGKASNDISWPNTASPKRLKRKGNRNDIISFANYFLRMRPPTETQKPFNLLLELTVSPSSSTISSILFTRSALLALFTRSWTISVNPAA